jgi:hypothetical protein
MRDIALWLTFPILLSGDENNQAPVFSGDVSHRHMKGIAAALGMLINMSPRHLYRLGHSSSRTPCTSRRSFCGNGKLRPVRDQCQARKETLSTAHHPQKLEVADL